MTNPRQPPVPPLTDLTPGVPRPTLLVDAKGRPLLDPMGPYRTAAPGYEGGTQPVRWLVALPTHGQTLVAGEALVDRANRAVADLQFTLVGRPIVRVGRALRARR